MSLFHRAVRFVNNSVQACSRLTKFTRRRPRRVDVEFADGSVFNLSAVFLRVQCPAADNKIRSIGAEKLMPSNFLDCHIWSATCGNYVCRDWGNYGIRIIFYDLHQTSIDTSDYLYELGSSKFTLMKKYIRTLKKHGLSPDPHPR